MPLEEFGRHHALGLKLVTNPEYFTWAVAHDSRGKLEMNKQAMVKFLTLDSQHLRRRSYFSRYAWGKITVRHQVLKLQL